MWAKGKNNTINVRGSSSETCLLEVLYIVPIILLLSHIAYTVVAIEKAGL